MSEDTPDTDGKRETICTFGSGAMVGLTSFRTLLKDYIEFVEKGGRVLLLRNDQPVALVIPIELAEKHGLMPQWTTSVEAKKALEGIMSDPDLSMEEVRRRLGRVIDLIRC